MIKMMYISILSKTAKINRSMLFVSKKLKCQPISRFCSLISTTEKLPEEVATDLNTAEKLWNENKQMNNLKKFLFQCFCKEKNCFSYALNLMTYTSDYNKKKSPDFAFAIMLSFSEWLNENSSLQPLTLNTKTEALKAILAHKDRCLTQIVCDVYRLRENRLDLKTIVETLLVKKKFEEACQCVVILNLQKEFPVEKIVLPLIFQGKIGYVMKYLDDNQDLFLELATKLDRYIDEAEEIKAVSKTIMKGKSKMIYKCLAIMIKAYNSSPELYPNFYKQRLNYAVDELIKRRFEQTKCESSWEEITLVAFKNKPELQKIFIDKLVSINEVATAQQMANKLFVSRNDWPSSLLNAEMINSRLDSQMEVENNDNQNILKEKTAEKPIEYLSFHLNCSDITFVSTKQQFIDCLNDILQNYAIVGIDSEWKSQELKSQELKLQELKSKVTSPSRLSILQLAMHDKVYILDMLSLTECLQKEHWDNLMEDFFGNPKILKLGCGLVQDVQMLVEDYKGTNGKIIKFAQIMDIAILFRNFHEFYSSKLLVDEECHNTKGLSTVCDLVLGKPLNKDERLCDWEKRPLTEAQIIYSALDAYCLLQIFEELEACAKDSDMDFIKFRNKAINSTACMTRETVKIKQKFKWGMGNGEFFFEPSINVQEFKVLADSMLQNLGLKLRMFGVDVVILKHSDTYDDAIKITQAEERIFLTSAAVYEQIKDTMPRRLCFGVPESVECDQLTAAHIFQHYNVKMTAGAIFSRCMECNSDQFLNISSDDLKTLWTKLNTQKNHLNSNAENDCEPSYLSYDNGFVNSANAVMNTGVQIQLNDLSYDMFSKPQTIRTCLNCGKVHCER